MRPSTEKMIAVQLLTLIMVVTALLLAQLPGGTRHTQGSAHLLSWRGMSVSSASPWHSPRRLIHREFRTGRDQPDATVALPPAPTPATENSRVQ